MPYRASFHFLLSGDICCHYLISKSLLFIFARQTYLFKLYSFHYSQRQRAALNFSTELSGAGSLNKPCTRLYEGKGPFVKWFHP